MVQSSVKNSAVFRVTTFVSLALALSVIHGILLDFAGFNLNTILYDTGSLFVMTVLFINLFYVVQRYYHSDAALNLPNVSTLLLFTGLTVLVNYLVTGNPGDEVILYTSISVKLIGILMLYTIVILSFWIDQQKVQEQRIKAFAVKKEREALHIQLNSLQQQLKPHFLFNSLNSINALTLSNPEEARKMIHLLSEFMRGSIRTSESEIITLEDEIRHIQLYTDIEKVRFGNRLNVNYTIPEETKSMKVPGMILQPLIENSIKYGLYGHTEAVMIDIEASAESNYLVIRVTNPYDRVSSAGAKGTGYGMQSVEKKMLILYSQSNLIQVENSGDRFSVILKIPQS